MGGKSFEPGEFNSSALLACAPGRDTFRPEGVTDDYVLSTFEIEIDGERGEVVGQALTAECESNLNPRTRRTSSLSGIRTSGR